MENEGTYSSGFHSHHIPQYSALGKKKNPNQSWIWSKNHYLKGNKRDFIDYDTFQKHVFPILVFSKYSTVSTEMFPIHHTTHVTGVFWVA